MSTFNGVPNQVASDSSYIARIFNALRLGRPLWGQMWPRFKR